MHKTYNIKVDEKQLAILRDACDLIARLGIGQWREIINELPFQDDVNWTQFHQELDIIGARISKYTKDNVDGYASNLGIYNEDVRERARTAWDMHQVFRHRIAHDGLAGKEPEHYSVCYNSPVQASAECNLCEVIENESNN